MAGIIDDRVSWGSAGRLLAVLGVGLIASCSAGGTHAGPRPEPVASPGSANVERAIHVTCERGPGMGKGGMGMGMGMGMGGMGMGMGEDMDRIHQLLGGHERITRKVVERPDGIESWTTSDDPVLAATLPVHVEGMAARMKEGKLIHGFDPLFRKVFGLASQIEVTIERLPDGVHVIERGSTPLAVAAIRAHAQVVSWFQAFGMTEAHRCHDVAPGS